MTENKTPGYVELLGAIGVFYISKTVIETATEMSGILEAPLSDLAGFVGGAAIMLAYVAFRNRQNQK